MSSQANPGATQQPATLPLEYERSKAERIDGIWRKGDALIVPIGADLSRCCIQCGRACAGKPVRLQYVPQNSGTDVRSGGSGDHPLFFLLAVLFTLGSAIGAASEARAEAKGKTLTIGLCERHARRERIVKWAALIALLLSIALFVGGLVTYLVESHSPQGLTSDFPTMSMTAGGLFTFFVPLVILSRLKRPRIALVDEGRMVVLGVGAPFLDAQVDANEPNRSPR